MTGADRCGDLPTGTAPGNPVGHRPPLIMGVLNVTPDSFSDGGRWSDHDAAVTHGLRMVAEGADIVDVGGESTRPGAGRPSTDEELARVLPVITRLSREGVAVSVDTMRAPVAAAAIAAGAVVVNDVSGGLADPGMPDVVSGTGVRYVAMHWRGHSVDMQDRAVYRDVVTDVRDELDARAEALLAAGLAREQLVLDPGVGFAKTAEHNWSLLARLDELLELGYPLLVGTSRKSFLGLLEADADGVPSPPAARDAATAATSLVCAMAGVWAVRVHDVLATRSALRVAGALKAAS